MTIEEIKHLYDHSPNMTLGQLADITGKTIQELKFILTCTDEEYDAN